MVLVHQAQTCRELHVHICVGITSMASHYDSGIKVGITVSGAIKAYRKECYYESN